MTKKPKKTTRIPSKLRQRAEKHLEAYNQGESLPHSFVDNERLVHELQVHQVELELQKEELIESQARVEAGMREYTDLYDFAPVGYATLNPDGTIHKINLTGATLLGEMRAKLVNYHLDRFIDPASRSVFNDFLKGVFESHANKSCEVALITTGHERLWMHIEGKASEDTLHCNVIILDITVRVKAEQAARASEVRFHQLADAMPQIVWSNDASGRIDYLNQRWFDYTGLSFEDRLRDPNVHVHPEDRPIAEAAWAENLVLNKPFEYELRLRRGDGTYRWHLARCVPARDDAGKIIGWYGTSTDIHKLKQAELDAQFLSEYAALLDSIGNAEKIAWPTALATAQHLAVKRAGFNSIDVKHNRVAFQCDYCAGVASLAGTYPLSAFGPALSGNLAINNTQTDPRTAAHYETIYGPAGLCSLISVPLLHDGQWSATFWVAEPEPRVWTTSEVDLIHTIAARMWLKMENALLHRATKELNTVLEARVVKRTVELSASQAQLRKLSAYIEHSREEERTRIAREVHDQLGGALTGLTMDVARATKMSHENVNLTVLLTDMRRQCTEIIETVRRISTDLRPPMLDDFGLIAVLEWQTGEWNKQTGIPYRLDLPATEVKLDRECRTAIFRVFQESLTNITRHAQATEVTIALQYDSQNLVLTVQDNGRGINEEILNSGTSLGLLGMHERIGEVYGKLDISGAPGKGTTVIISVPITTTGSSLKEHTPRL